MRMEVMALLRPESMEHEVRQPIGAVVARARPAGGVALELGPADGAPLIRLNLTTAEAQRLCATLEAIVSGSDEEILLTDD